MCVTKKKELLKNESNETGKIIYLSLMEKLVLLLENRNREGGLRLSIYSTSDIFKKEKKLVQ